LSADFHLVAEEGSPPGGGRAVIVRAAGDDGGSAPDAPLRPGDVIRQANGVRVERCADLEHAAADAVVRGLRLLVLIERDGGVLAVATGGSPQAQVATKTDTRALSAPSGATTPPRNDADALPVRGTPIPRVRVEPELPAREQAGADVTAAAETALGALRALDGVARTTTPITLYERRLGDAERLVATLDFGTSAAGEAVRGAVDDVLAHHRTARDIWQMRVAHLRSRGTDVRGVSGQPLPYFTDSQVPGWIGEWPFLQATVLSAPRETRILQAAGSWDAERAIELLWARAHDATERLAVWLGR
jgi:hypothetical protein